MSAARTKLVKNQYDRQYLEAASKVVDAEKHLARCIRSRKPHRIQMIAEAREQLTLAKHHLVRVRTSQPYYRY